MIWDGGHTKQATWFNAMLKLGARTYDFRQLCETGTVVISRTGKIAVFSAEHAEEDEANLALLKEVQQGHAFMGSGMTPRLARALRDCAGWGCAWSPS